MTRAFVNGPIQNGNFTFAERPGAAAGLRIADIFNELSGIGATPHLWNTATLKGDVQYAQSATGEGRDAYEQRRILEKYDGTTLRHAPIMTDADPEVADLGLSMIERGLSSGQLQLADEVVNVCKGCAHMVGSAATCKACGGADVASQLQRHLVFDRDTSAPVLTPEDTYAQVDTRTLANEGGHVPSRLILSKTRAYGIELAGIGLKDLVLDPRAGLHVTVLAAGRHLEADEIAMVITPKAASGLVAYGLPFRRASRQVLTYALHGYIPYDTVMGLATQEQGDQTGDHKAFADWFMPVNSMASRRPIPALQVPSLYKFFAKVVRSAQEPGLRQQLRVAVRAQVQDGNLRWITDKAKLTAVLPETTPVPDPNNGPPCPS